MITGNLKKYLILAGMTMAALVAVDVGINVAVDPLFFFDGNKITGKGHFLNERISVLAYNRHRWPKVDCLIFGSSRMTYLDARNIREHTCANIAFSGGQLNEFIIYAEYLRNMGVKPNLVIVGTDNFDADLSANNEPQFVNEKTPLPGWLGYYTSIDSLFFSIQALAEITMSPHYYASSYRKHFGSDTRQPGSDYTGDNFIFPPEAEKSLEHRIELYRQLCKTFPQASCVGIVPPVSTFGVEKGLKQGLMPYLSSMQKLARVFTAFYDFSVPAKPEWDFAETVDGIHFSASVYDRIAAKIENPAHEAWGFDVKALPFALYKKRYIEDAQKAVEKRKQFVARNPGIADNSKGH